MRAILLTVFLWFAAAVPAAAKTLTIGIDQSMSNPLMLDEGVARIVGRNVGEQIAALQPGDWVHVRTFGERSAVNFQVEKIRITRSVRADKVADLVSRFIASLPSRAKKGQSSTNIIAFLEFGQFDCANGGRIFLLTDGIESSAYIHERDLVAGKPLPAPEPNILAGCEVTMLGLGQSTNAALPPQAIKALRASWTAWMKAAGASFNAVIDP